MHMLDIYFDRISFYPSVSKDLDLYAENLGIVNSTKNFQLDFDPFSDYYLSWSFN